MFKKAISRVVAILLLVCILTLPFNVRLGRTEAEAESDVEPTGIITKSSDGVDWWPKYGHDINNSGYSTSKAPKTNVTAWVVQVTTSAIRPPPTVVNGILYVGSYDHKLYARDADSGAALWNYTTGGIILSQPAVADGVIYFGSEDAHAYALDAATGAFKWSTLLGSGVGPSSPAVHDGRVYIGSYGMDRIFALDTLTGSVLWSSYSPGQHMGTNPAVTSGRVYYGTWWIGHAYGVRETDGARVFDFSDFSNVGWPSNYVFSDESWSNPTVGDGKVFFGEAWRGRAHAFDASTGTKLWTSQPLGAIAGWYTGFAFHDGIVYAGVGTYPPEATDVRPLPKPTLYALNASNGNQIWSYIFGAAGENELNPTVPVIADGMVFIVSNDTLHAFDIVDGSLIWKYAADTRLTAPVIADNTLYVGSESGKVYAFRVKPPIADFRISASPSIRSIAAGSTTTYTVKVTLTGGTTEPVVLAVSGLPLGATAIFNPASGYPTFSSTLKISTSINTPSGTYTLKLRASSSGMTRSTTVQLTVKPKITSFSVSPNLFSPNGDGRKDTTKIKASFTETVSWTLDAKNSTNHIIRTWTGTGLSLEIIWDGKDSGGQKVPDGNYTIVLSGQSSSSGIPLARNGTKKVTVDTTLPTVTGVSVNPPSFNPSLGETTTISYTISEPCYVTIKIYNPSGSLVRTLLNKALKAAGSNSVVWNGKDNVGNIVPPGAYTIKIWVEDKAGNRASPYPITTTVTVL